MKNPIKIKKYTTQYNTEGHPFTKKDFLSKKNHLFFSPSQLANLPESSKIKICNQISDMLTHFPKQMIPHSPIEINTFISQLTAYAILDIRNLEVIGFLRFLKLVEKKPTRKGTFELGSWIINKKYRGFGYGQKLLNFSLIHFKSNHPKSKIIAIVHKRNIASQKIFEKFGAKILKKPLNIIFTDSKINDKNYFYDLKTLDSPKSTLSFKMPKNLISFSLGRFFVKSRSSF